MKRDYDYPENHKETELVWQKDNKQFTILKCRNSHYCGYVRFEKRPMIEQGYDGILTYVPVHGGITYASEDKNDDSMVYGFDCAHCDDENNPNCTNIEWLKNECENMGKSIEIASQYEGEYLLAKTNEDKAKILDGFHKELDNKLNIQFNVTNNFGAMLKFLGGSL